MKVFKFGGASVKDADSVRNVASIVKRFSGEELLLVISAMGKTTNKLELLVKAFLKESVERFEILKEVKDFHENITQTLMGESSNRFYEVDNLFIELECMIEAKPEQKDYDVVYDQMVSFGELISTRIISHVLNLEGIVNRWVDARNFIVTDSHHRRAFVQWDSTNDLISKKLKPLVKKQLVVTQGFIARSENQQTTTLGREGSDYSASIFAYGLNADSVTIWKDVEGVMNADPKRMPDAVFLPEVSFLEAIELAYYGATVIHPKTIQPIRSKNIPLFVKSFVNPEKTGTVISNHNQEKVVKRPCYIIKENQVMVSLSSKDFSFIIEDNLSHIFAELAECNIQLNLMQNSAISFSFCATFEEQQIKKLVQKLEKEYMIKTIDHLELITIFNYKSEESALKKVVGTREVILEQLTASVIQVVVPAV
jgi:aspartate kinase